LDNIGENNMVTQYKTPEKGRENETPDMSIWERRKTIAKHALSKGADYLVGHDSFLNSLCPDCNLTGEMELKTFLGYQ
jgi:hypothetical protein